MLAFIRKKTDLLKTLLTQDRESRVILIEGPRQVGKTTVALQCLQNLKHPHLALNLERDLRHQAAIDRCQEFREFTEWLKDEFDFVPDGSKILFIDEAQESRQLGRFVRFMKEEWYNTKSILTGSMMTRLFHDDIRYPVGRVHTVTIEPFSFFEYLGALDKKDWLKILESGQPIFSEQRHEKVLEEFNRYLQIGGLPQVIQNFVAKKNYHDTRTEIFENYRQDFMRVYGQDQGFLFEQALRAVADHVGSPSKMTQALPLQDKQYKNMAAIFTRLEAWRMIHTSVQRGTQPEGTTDFHPKRYLFDLGILSQLRTQGVPDLHILKTLGPEHRRSLGGILENHVATSLIGMGIALTGFKKASTGMEIDFIAKLNNRILPMECKASLKTKETHLTGLKSYMKEYGLKLGVLVNLAPFEIRKYDFGEIVVLPAYAVEALASISIAKSESF